MPGPNRHTKLPTPTWAYKTGQAKLTRAINKYRLVHTMVEGKWRALCVFTIGAHRQGNILYPAGKPGKTRRKNP